MRHDGGVPRDIEIGWTRDPREYLPVVESFLRQRPVEHSVLWNAATVKAQGPVDEANMWLWVRDGDVQAAAHHTPPYGAYVSTGPDAAMVALAEALRSLRPELPGVGGMRPAADAFARGWCSTAAPGQTPAAHLLGEQGVFVAGDVNHPHGVPGGLRLACAEDLPLLRSWAEAFADETSSPTERDGVDRRIAAGLLFVWQAAEGPVSMAAVTAPRGGVSRVQLVYTPPELRGHGYASACVAALTAQQLAIPGRQCMLYTDLANPTSNGIYQAIGYRRVADAVTYRFATGDSC